MKAVLSMVAVLCLVATCEAGQEVIQYARTRNVSALSGTVTDPSGAAIPNVQVCSMTAGWRRELQCATTNAEGRWTLPPRSGANTYQLRFMKDGFQQVWIRVRLTKRKVVPFRVTLPVAT